MKPLIYIAIPLGLRLLGPVSLSVFAAEPVVKDSGQPASRGTDALHGVLADYDAELRLPNGRVDLDGMVTRLKQLGVNTYFWLIWHAATDWEDLKRFLPEAAKAGINVWVYLVPPSESPPHTERYSEPFRLDYRRWAKEIAQLSLKHSNLTAWVIDDFYGNRQFFTPQYVGEMQREAKRINPRLAFLPLMYFRQITLHFIDAYRRVIDGVVVAYPQDEEEIEGAWALLNDVYTKVPGRLSYPRYTPSQAGEFVKVTQTARVLPADRYTIRFRERDDFTGQTAGYHFKQLLVDGKVVWEQDVAGGEAGWRSVVVDVTELVAGKRQVEVAFRLFERKGVSNFGVRWLLRDLQVEGLQLAADLNQPQAWEVDKQGQFEAGFGDALQVKGGSRRFHLPFIVMTAGSASQFRKRHGEPATPERIAQWVQMCLK
ncbi:MAG TPA: hypothetical protein EYP85_05380, partial [Armatimonadetes bacterium]|nr:hypothetical protein [Armatimonadota bacterium]